MIDLEVVTEFVYAHFEQVKVTKHGTHFLARCPLCGDSKKSQLKRRFNLDYNNGVPGYKCFNCDKDGNFYKIYSIIKGISYDDAVEQLKNWKWDESRVKDRLSRKNTKKEKTEFTHYNWIKESCLDPPERYIQALKNFYNDRIIDPIEHKLYIAYDGRYKNRIIFPIFDADDNIVYFQARRIPKTGIIPKYDNPASPKEIIIMNSHLFDPDKYIIVPEGIIDAWMIGTQGTTCLGKYISEDFLEKLFPMTSKGVIVALDNDTEGEKACLKFMKENKYSRKVKFFFHPSEFSEYDDINSIVRGKSVQNVYDLITRNSVNFSTAYTKITISNKLLEGKSNANNESRNRLYKSKRR
jgi:DNA primase